VQSGFIQLRKMSGGLLQNGHNDLPLCHFFMSRTLTVRLMQMSKNQSPVKIMIVEDHALFREGLKKVLEETPGVEVVGEAENGAVFLELLKHAVPDLVFMDLKMPVMDGMIATEEALKRYPGLRIIILSMFGEEDYLFTMINKGICGYILKTARVFEIERAIDLVSSGDQYFSSELNGMLAKKLKQYTSNELTTFSERENEILKLLCKGLSTTEISTTIHLSKRTVEGYRAKLLEKTRQPNVINLILYSLKNKLVSVDEVESRNP
jgi:DNA-binding NarL/FixJ family response regulator